MKSTSDFLEFENLNLWDDLKKRNIVKLYILIGYETLLFTTFECQRKTYKLIVSNLKFKFCKLP
jgi:hypothetical protein